MGPQISVIIPTYYRNDLLEEAIESVLKQEYEPVELVVVDDSGEGHAEPVFQRYDRVIDKAIVREENGGCGSARTTGIKAATGEYVHFLDDDDIFLEGKLHKTAEVLNDQTGVGVAYSGVKQDNGWHKYPDEEMAGDVLEPTLRFETFPCYTCSMLIERELLVDMLPLPDLIAANDTNFMIELARRTEFDYVDELLVYNRREESETWVGMKKIEGMKQVLSLQSELYDQFPAIHRAVLTKIYHMEGQVRLERQVWTPRATACFARAAYYAEEGRITYAGATVTSLLGRPGFRTAGKIRGFVKDRL